MRALTHPVPQPPITLADIERMERSSHRALIQINAVAALLAALGIFGICLALAGGDAAHAIGPTAAIIGFLTAVAVIGYAFNPARGRD